MLTIVIIVTLAVVGAVESNSNLLDLSYEYETNVTLSWVVATLFTLTPVQDGTPPGAQYYVYTNDFSTSEHSGTHLDAPAHFHKGSWSVEQIPLERLVNLPLLVIDVRDKVAGNSSYLLQVSDIVEWEGENGEIPSSHSLLLVRTGWAERYPDRETYFGTSDHDISKLVFPSISGDAAEWIVDNRKGVVGVGLDSPSVDYPQTQTAPSHTALCSANVYILENINANINDLPHTGARVSVMPMKIKGGSGAPARVWVDLEGGNSGAPCQVTRSRHITCALGILTALIVLM